MAPKKGPGDATRDLEQGSQKIGVAREVDEVRNGDHEHTALCEEPSNRDHEHTALL